MYCTLLYILYITSVDLIAYGMLGNEILYLEFLNVTTSTNRSWSKNKHSDDETDCKQAGG